MGVSEEPDFWLADVVFFAGIGERGMIAAKLTEMLAEGEGGFFGRRSENHRRLVAVLDKAAEGL